MDSHGPPMGDPWGPHGDLWVPAWAPHQGVARSSHKRKRFGWFSQWIPRESSRILDNPRESSRILENLRESSRVHCHANRRAKAASEIVPGAPGLREGWLIMPRMGRSVERIGTVM